MKQEQLIAWKPTSPYLFQSQSRFRIIHFRNFYQTAASKNRSTFGTKWAHFSKGQGFRNHIMFYYEEQGKF
jgi:hypothetical protein